MSIQNAGFSLEFLFTGNSSVQPVLVNFEPKTQGERIRFLRENRRKTEIEIAEATRFSVHDIYCFENNKKEVLQNFIIVFAHEMKVNHTWLETGIGPMDKTGVEEILVPSSHELKQEVERLKSYVDYLKKIERQAQMIINVEKISKDLFNGESIQIESSENLPMLK